MFLLLIANGVYYIDHTAPGWLEWRKVVELEEFGDNGSSDDEAPDPWRIREKCDTENEKWDEDEHEDEVSSLMSFGCGKISQISGFMLYILLK